MSIQLTPTAAARAQSFIGRTEGAQGLRFSVKRTGCSGWAYVVEVADQAMADEQAFVDQGVTVYVPSKHLKLLDGTLIDFERRGLNAEFVFRNPNVTAVCGCGESFTTEMLD